MRLNEGTMCTISGWVLTDLRYAGDLVSTPYNVEQRHIMYLGSRVALGRTWMVVVRMGNTRLTYKGFLHFTGGFVEGIAISRKYIGGRSSHHQPPSVCKWL